MGNMSSDVLYEEIIADLRSENERLEELLLGDVEAVCDDEGMHVSHPLFRLFLETIYELFQIEGAENYLELIIGDGKKDYVVSIQNKKGLTPHEKNERLEKRVREMEAETEYLKKVPHCSYCDASGIRNGTMQAVVDAAGNYIQHRGAPRKTENEYFENLLCSWLAFCDGQKHMEDTDV